MDLNIYLSYILYFYSHQLYIALSIEEMCVYQQNIRMAYSFEILFLLIEEIG